MKLANLADLKRHMATLPALTLVQYLVNGQPASHKYLNVPRRVASAATRDFGVADANGVESYMSWPKAAELTLHNEHIADSIPAQTRTVGFAIRTECLTLVYRFDPDGERVNPGYCR